MLRCRVNFEDHYFQQGSYANYIKCNGKNIYFFPISLCEMVDFF